ncbi:MAG: bifunctional DNA primase/polymerase, partial [Arenicellales bacterium]|nr:bifunctional DNA primase/polymerase [Arenicellales bacterium]
MNKSIHAHNFAEAGQKIFPCNPNGKEPITSNGFKDASSQTETIKIWWENYPEANIGLVTGVENNLLVIDVDNKDGVDGNGSLEELEA